MSLGLDATAPRLSSSIDSYSLRFDPVEQRAYLEIGGPEIDERKAMCSKAIDPTSLHFGYRPGIVYPTDTPYLRPSLTS